MTQLPEWWAALRQAMVGLTWISESEAPLTGVYWPSISFDTLTPARVLALTQHPLDTPIEGVAFEDCWAPMVRSQSWHGPFEQQQVARYQTLVQLLRAHLEDLRVYRIGQIQIDVYTLGRTADNTVAGVKTRAIET